MRKQSSKPNVKDYFSQFKIWLAPAVTAGVIILLSQFAVKPRIIVISQKISERKQQRERLNKVLAKIDKLENLDKELFKERMLLLNEALPGEPELPQFLYTIEKLARQAGLVVDSMLVKGLAPNEKAGSQKSAHQSIGVAMTLRGRQEQVSGLIRQIEIFRRLISVDKVQLSRLVQGASPSANVSATVQIKTFFAPLPSSLGSPEEPIESLSARDETLLTELKNRLSDLSFEPETMPRQIATKSAVDRNPFER